MRMTDEAAGWPCSADAISCSNTPPESCIVAGGLVEAAIVGTGKTATKPAAASRRTPMAIRPCASTISYRQRRKSNSVVIIFWILGSINNPHHKEPEKRIDMTLTASPWPTFSGGRASSGARGGNWPGMRCCNCSCWRNRLPASGVVWACAGKAIASAIGPKQPIPELIDNISYSGGQALRTKGYGCSHDVIKL
jgi:hypothetical protein